MANAITKTVLHDGKRNLVVHVNIVGDGSGEEAATILIDRSVYAPTDGLKLTLRRVQGHLTSFAARLLFDGNTDLEVVQLPTDQWFDYSWRKVGGISSPKAGTGYTGDLLITTVGLALNDRGSFTLEMTKN